MANKDKSGSKSSKTAASKSLKEKRQAKKEKAARASSSGVSAGKWLVLLRDRRGHRAEGGP